MSRASTRLKSRIKSSNKPLTIAREPKTNILIEFRWSTTAAQQGIPEKNSLINVNLINIENSQQKCLFPPPPSSPAQKSTPNQHRRLSMEKHSSSSSVRRLPNINKKNKELSNTPNENLSTKQINPLMLTYAQLYHAQYPIERNLNSRLQHQQNSHYHLLNDHQTNFSIIKNDFVSSRNQARLKKNEKYLRLQTSQLKQLQVSDKYLKEATKLYFDAKSKVFLPRQTKR